MILMCFLDELIITRLHLFFECVPSSASNICISIFIILHVDHHTNFHDDLNLIIISALSFHKQFDRVCSWIQIFQYTYILYINFFFNCSDDNLTLNITSFITSWSCAVGFRYTAHGHCLCPSLSCILYQHNTHPSVTYST